MPLFVRPAPWYRIAYPPSETPSGVPNEVTDNVQLTASYDGGGLQYTTPETMVLQRTTGAVAAGDSTEDFGLVSAVDQVNRLWEVSATLTGNVNNTQIRRLALLLQASVGGVLLGTQITFPHVDCTGAAGVGGDIVSLPHPIFFPRTMKIDLLIRNAVVNDAWTIAFFVSGAPDGASFNF